MVYYNKNTSRVQARQGRSVVPFVTHFSSTAVSPTFKTPYTCEFAYPTMAS